MAWHTGDLPDILPGHIFPLSLHPRVWSHLWLTTSSVPWLGPLWMCVSMCNLYTYMRVCVCICILHLCWISTPWPEQKSLSPPRKQPRLYLAGQRCRRGLQWVPLCSGWREGRRPQRCRTSPCRHRRSCTRARSACLCCSARGGRCRWSGWGGKRCSAHAVWSQSASSKSTPYCLGADNKRRGELIHRASMFSRKGRLKKNTRPTSTCFPSFF